MPAWAALQYSTDGFDTRTAQMVGRRMAGETFLKAWIDHAGADPLTAWVQNRPNALAFQSHVRELGATVPLAVAGPQNFKPLADAGTLWLADPNLQRYAWQRRWFRQDAWSIVGITHTISTPAAMDLIQQLLTSPVQPWDALICTSRAVKQAVVALVEEQAAYLRERVGATALSGPELPIIPLGVHCDSLAADPAARIRWRAELGIPDSDVAILQFGRLALHVKAHVQPLLLALRQAAQAGGPRLHLILAGQPVNPGQGEWIRELARSFAGSVTTHFVDGARPDAGSVRSAADIFTLLSDSTQESFGLAPVEGMAAGLPVVGSDWDGLRDTIEHGVTGFLIDTLMPPVGTGEAIARRHAIGEEDYDHYMGAVAQMTSVDIGQAAQAFATLAADPALRQRMGAAGQARARALFDWRHVIAAYRALIDQLAQVRSMATERAPRGEGRQPDPSRMDPCAMFAAYPTARLEGSTRLSATGLAGSLADLPGGVDTAVMGPRAIPNRETLDAVLAYLAYAPATVAELCGAFPTEDRRQLVAGAAFLIKFGLVRRA